MPVKTDRLKKKRKRKSTNLRCVRDAAHCQCLKNDELFVFAEDASVGGGCVTSVKMRNVRRQRPVTDAAAAAAAVPLDLASSTNAKLSEIEVKYAVNISSHS